uniref:very-long-chain 3-oxoacyl-CoA reductase-like n=1 Tax=Styela clava TaxID=7725 RepID=UPI0019399F94|nr:very-long-chain 3-oxoacyl-CoA reductase-like [Styela clava]
MMDFTDIANEGFLLYGIGILTIIYVTIRIALGLYYLCTAYFIDSFLDLTAFGKWAVVTGSTDGIGKAFAVELAKLGLNIILISRNPEKLNQVSKEIKEHYKIETMTIAYDFTNFDSTIDEPSPYGVISSVVRDLDVGILVNNVGMPSPKTAAFLDAFNDGESLALSTTNLIHCNASSRVKMMEIILPGMVNRGRGLIINVSSLASSFTCPMLCAYGASKRFDDTLSRALEREYRKHGIVIQSIQPGIVRTNMTRHVVKKSSMAIPTPERYANCMIKTIGKSTVTTGYWAHELIRLFYASLPDLLVPWIIKWRLRRLNQAN